MNFPNAIESEKVVLHHLFNKNTRAIEKIIDFDSDLFLDEANVALLSKIISDASSGIDYDPLSVAQYLSDNKALIEAGGSGYIKSIINDYGYGLDTHFDIVKEKAYLRQYATLASEAALNIVQNKENLGNKLTDYEYKLAMLKEKFVEKGKGLEPASSITNTVIENINSVIDSESKYIGLPTGFQGLDELSLGLHRTDLTIVAARASSGKSSFFGSIIDNIISTDINKTLLVFSLEMSKTQLLQRLIASIGFIPMQHIRSGKMSEFEWARFLFAIDLICQSRLFIDDTPAITVAQLEARIQTAKAKNPQIDLVVLDYLQLMSPTKMTDNRAFDVGQISAGLKGTAKKYDVPLLSLSQLSRSPDKRPDHRPILSDLRESGRLEQDADNVWFIYREELFTPTVENRGVAEIIVEKQRQGALGTIPLAFIKDYVRFMNVAYRI